METKPQFRAAVRNDWSVKMAGALAAVIVAWGGANASWAQGTLAYSFEGGLQGFGANGPGSTVTHDTIGATDGTMSMKFSIVAGATFVGMLTGELAPQIADPPGLDFVIFDLTLTEQFPALAFVSAGISIFGVSQPDYPGGQVAADVQFSYPNDEAALGDLAVGTHTIRLNLPRVFHPLTFAENSSFSDIYGSLGSGPNDVIATGFQIYINKPNTGPWTGYVDNIRMGVNPNANFNGDAAVDNLDLEIWKGAYHMTIAGDADRDMDTDGDDFLYWQQQVGPIATVSSIPEPTTMALAGTVALALAGIARRRERTLRGRE